MTPRTGFAVAVLALLVLGSFFLSERRPESPDAPDAALPASYYLQDVVLRTTDALGAVRYRLHAARADHDATDGSIALETLRLDYGGAGARWRFEADRGRLPEDESMLSLVGNVRARALDGPEDARTAFDSPTLQVDIGAERAATDDPVRFTFARGTLEGVGLDADFANERVTVRSDVRGVFLPPPR